jgi:membrane associated rhomboid family serine protease
VVKPPNPVAEFRKCLAELTPRAYVTPAIIAINVAVFVLMVASGVNPVEPTTDSLVQWGADYGPKTLHGQWWRLLTATFLHIGILHLLFNMWAFWEAGLLVERLVGNAGFLALYVISGLAGSLASEFWNPQVVSAGASGAVFGVFGALLGVLLQRRDCVPAQALSKLRNSGIALVGYNLVYGFLRPGINVAAHLGGLAAGFLCGLALSQPLTREAVARRPTRNGLVAGAAGVLIVLAIVAMPKEVTDLQRELAAFEAVEAEAIKTAQTTADRVDRGEIPATELADVLEREVLPPWRATTDRFRAMKHLPADQQRLVVTLLEYLQARQSSWELLAQSIRENDLSKKARADAQARIADQCVEKLQREAKAHK